MFKYTKRIAEGNFKNYFTFMWPYIVTNFFLLKPTRHTNFPSLFCQKNLHVSGISTAHHQGFSTVHSTLVYFMQVWWQLPSRVRMELQFHPDCTAENSWWWTEEMPERCRVFWQNKFGKLVRLVGFIKKKFVTMRGHMNVKFEIVCFAPTLNTFLL
jgi:hypothetical protein